MVLPAWITKYHRLLVVLYRVEVTIDVIDFLLAPVEESKTNFACEFCADLTMGPHTKQTQEQTHEHHTEEPESPDHESHLVDLMNLIMSVMIVVVICVGLIVLLRQCGNSTQDKVDTTHKNRDDSRVINNSAKV